MHLIGVCLKRSLGKSPTSHCTKVGANGGRGDLVKIKECANSQLYERRHPRNCTNYPVLLGCLSEDFLLTPNNKAY
jgi:hypothetical protein